MSETFKTDKGTIHIGWNDDHVVWRSETKTSRRSFKISFEEGLRVANEINTARPRESKSIDVNLIDGVGKINIQMMTSMAKIAEPPTAEEMPVMDIEPDELTGIASTLRILHNAELRSRLKPLSA